MNRIKKYFSILLMLSQFICHAQKDSVSSKKAISKNIVFIEALGNGGFFTNQTWYTLCTLNYERTLNTTAKNWYSIRVGFTTAEYPHDEVIHKTLIMPLMFNIITNPIGKNHIENGFGLIYSRESDPYQGDDNEFGVAYSLKYRYQNNKKKGLFFAIGYTPNFFLKKMWRGEFSILVRTLSGGLNLGYHF